MGDQRPPWTFLTNHGHVLLAVARDPDARVEDIATTVGISARATLTILKALEEAGYITRTRVGRRTSYAVRRHRRFRHPSEAAHEVDDLIDIFLSDGRGDSDNLRQGVS